MIIGIIKVGNGLVPVEEFRNAVDVESGVADFCNEYDPPLNESDYIGVNGDSLNLSKQWAYDSTTPGLTEIEHVNGSVKKSSLDTYKNELIAQIGERRDYKLNNYFILTEYPSGSGNMFSCSVVAQAKYEHLYTLFASGIESGPFTVYTHDNRSQYVVVNLADMVNFIGAVSRSILDEHTTAGQSVMNVLTAIDKPSALLAAQNYL